VLGGDGTLTIATKLQKYGFRFVAIPKSIDNDLSGTDFTFGFFSAVEVGKQALTSLHSTAFSHDRVLVVELMGREVGWITLYSGLAASCEMIFVPEIDFSFKGIVKHLNYRRKIGKSYAVIAMAEGCVPKDHFKVESEVGNNGAEGRLGGISAHLADYINKNSGLEARNMALSYLQRSGLPSGYDSFLAMQYGTQAALMYKKGRFGYMASYKNGTFGEIRIENAVSKLKKVDARSQVVRLAKENGVYFGD
jgi:6-phosphofructokinase 1